jgi:hypothetical protein
MASKLYKVKNDKGVALSGNDKQQVVTAIQARENFTFGAFHQFWMLNCGCCCKRNKKYQ